MIEHLQLRNFLSFGPESEGFDLRALNVLIGPNGSGKSNFLEGLALLAATPYASRFASTLSQGGGSQEWLFRRSTEPAILSATSSSGQLISTPILHTLAFQERELQPFISRESIEIMDRNGERVTVYQNIAGEHEASFLRSNNGIARTLESGKLSRSNSVLSQFRDPIGYPELTEVARNYEGIRLYRNWIFGPHSPIRNAQPTHLPTDELLEDGSNLALYLNRLRENSEARQAIREGLRDLNESFLDFHVRVRGGSALLLLEEEHGNTIAPRISDGTLRYLALLALLCDPEPPRLVAIEEPELGLHPDLLLPLAELLKAASERTQLVVTTHSEMLVSCFSDSPEDVVVCEKIEGETYLERLDADRVGQWLDEDHQLGELWTRGDLGGNRWG